MNNYAFLDFTQTEAHIYDALSRTNEMDAKQLTKQLGVHKKVVYDNLARLETKSLISSVIKDNRAVYSITNPEILRLLIKKQEQELEEKKARTEELIQDLHNRTQSNLQEQEVQLYQGIRGVKHVLTTVIDAKQDYIAFGGPVQSENIIEESWWLNYHLKTQENNISAQLLFNKSLASWKEKIQHPRVQVRFFTNINPLTETIVFGDVAAVIVWSDNPIVTVIKNKSVADSYRDFFTLLWNQSSTE